MAAEADLAVDENLLGAQLVDTLAQVVDRDVDRTRDLAAVELLRRAYVDEGPAVGEGVVEFVPLEGALAGDHVVVDEAGHVDRVLRGAELRCVGQLEVRQVGGGEAGAHGGGDDVDTLVDALPTHGLCAEDEVGVGVDDDLEVDGLGTGVVAGVVGRVQVDDAQVLPGGARPALVPADGTGGESEDADDGGAEGGGAGHVASGDDVGDEAAVAVGGLG